MSKEDQKYFDYLMGLRDSGDVNMWGASIYLEAAFDLSSQEARDILVRWMKSLE